jgi:dipeptidyl aminopeptidase/acylaminoacyl peptidase
MRGRVLALALVAALLAPTAQAQTPRKTIEPADIVGLREAHDPQISPDGKDVLFVVKQRQDGGAPDIDTIWRASASGAAPARPFIQGDGTEGDPRWSPDGRSIAFVSKRKNPAAAKVSQQIWLIAADGGEARPLTSIDGDVSGLKWSPTGDRIAFLATDPDPQLKARQAIKRDQVEVNRGYAFQRLWVYDLVGGQARRISPEGVNVNGFDWAPDGRRFLAHLAETPKINEFYYRTRAVLMDATTGGVGQVIEPRAAGVGRWSPDGKRIIVTRLGEGGISVLPIIHDLASGTSTVVGADYRGEVMAYDWNADSRSLTVQSFEATSTVFFKVDAATGAMTRITDAVSAYPGFSLSRGGVVAYLGQSGDRPDEVTVLTGTKAARVSDVNPQVATWATGAVQQIKWTSSKDGRAIFGVLVTPPGYKPGTPTKTVVQIHGGPEWAWWSGWLGSWHEWAQMLASHGYVVFLPNPRGSDGQGDAFARAAWGDWGGADYQDILDGLDVLEKQGTVDPARVGIGGWSYGGFMSAWAITHGDRFKAAVIGAAPVELTMMAGTTDTPDFLAGYYGDLAKNRTLYDQHSPIRFVENARTPALILHGEQDTRVPLGQGQAFYGALRTFNQPVEMVTYPREPHWFREKAHQQDILERVLNWYDSHLGR